jgi:hypothetical protein
VGSQTLYNNAIGCAEGPARESAATVRRAGFGNTDTANGGNV